MQLASKRIGAIFAAACMIVALAFGGVAAFGKEYVEGQRTLTVTPIESVADDIGNANVKLDVYKIASATGDETYVTYNYDMVEPFNSDELKGYLTSGDWEKLAEGAVKVVADHKATKKTDGGLSEQISLGDETEGNGVFLVLPHGDGIDAEKLVAYSDIYEYSFKPIIVALPTKDGVDPNTGNLNSAYGDWKPNATVALKVEQKPAYGKLRITKEVTDNTESKMDATFVFHIVGTTPEGDKQGKTNDYDNYAQVMYVNGEAKDAVITMIPAGTKVTVTEVNPGAGFEAEESVVSELTISMNDENMAKATFKNTRNTPENPTYGIQNNFGVTGENADGSPVWEWKGANEEANAHNGL